MAEEWKHKKAFTVRQRLIIKTLLIVQIVKGYNLMTDTTRLIKYK